MNQCCFTEKFIYYAHTGHWFFVFKFAAVLEALECIDVIVLVHSNRLAIRKRDGAWKYQLGLSQPPNRAKLNSNIDCVIKSGGNETEIVRKIRKPDYNESNQATKQIAMKR